MELKNKVIIVTGASSGIGAAAANLFAAEGAKLILGARRVEKLEQLKEQIELSKGRAVYLSGDVTEENYNKRLVDFALSEYGQLDGAFNNAGMVGEMATIPQMDAANWNDVLSTNLTSGFYAAKYQIPAIAIEKKGSIVFTSSFVGPSISGLPGMSAYAASKAGLVGLVRCLATDHAEENIRVNAILPGGTKTAMAGEDPETQKNIAELHPLKRMAEPTEIAQAALYLLSDRSTFVTGSALAVDGGVSIKLG